MRVLLPTLLLALASLPARAVAPKDFVPSRAVGMGGGRAIASGNEAIFLNPAALGITRRYTVQLDYAHSTRSAAQGSGDGLVLSVVDSMSNPRFPSGIAYRYVSVGDGTGATKGNTKDVSVGVPIGGGFHFGTHVTHLSYLADGREFSQFTGDLGFAYVAGPIQLGLVGFNLIQVDSPDLARGASVGLSLSDERSYRLSGDVRWEWLEQKPVRSFSVGGEYLLANFLPLRAGYERDEVRQAEYFSGGTGILVGQQLGFDVSYRHERNTGAGIWAFAVKVFGN